jgi:hypothetical protein
VQPRQLVKTIVPFQIDEFPFNRTHASKGSETTKGPSIPQFLGPNQAGELRVKLKEPKETVNPVTKQEVKSNKVQETNIANIRIEK